MILPGATATMSIRPKLAQRIPLPSAVMIVQVTARPSGEGGESWTSSTAGRNSASRPLGTFAGGCRLCSFQASSHTSQCRLKVVMRLVIRHPAPLAPRLAPARSFTSPPAFTSPGDSLLSEWELHRRKSPVLELVQACVIPVLLQQLVVGPMLDDLPPVDHVDAIRGPHRAQPVRDSDAR